MSSVRGFGARRLVLIGTAVVLGSGMASAGLFSAAPAGADPGGVPNPAASGHARGHVAVCGPADPNSARCHSDLLTVNGRVVSAASAPVPGSFGPADLQSAYKLPSATAGSGQTVAIVDAYNDPSAESDMGVYRSHYRIPSCTSANGCFRKVNQNGSTSYPRNNASWSQEIALDLDMVSAACPGCHILLVEASSPSYGNLGTAVNTAVRLGATEVSNSYGGSEFSSETSYDTYYNHPGVAITASSGDNGYGVQYPAASPDVTGVGGTSLSRATNTRGWSETAWSGAGSGCSSYEPKPSWQSNCGSGHRTVADVSAVADPNTGVAVYDSYAYQGYSGWLVFGGTSVASPIIASTYALAGNAASVVSGSYSYSHTSSLNDITSGTNSSSGCSLAYLCAAGPGYDGPTGNGTPASTGAF